MSNVHDSIPSSNSQKRFYSTRPFRDDWLKIQTILWHLHDFKIVKINLTDSTFFWSQTHLSIDLEISGPSSHGVFIQIFLRLLDELVQALSGRWPPGFPVSKNIILGIAKIMFSKTFFISLRSRATDRQLNSILNFWQDVKHETKKISKFWFAVFVFSQIYRTLWKKTTEELRKTRRNELQIENWCYVLCLSECLK